jgi:acetyl esterase/lipase
LISVVTPISRTLLFLLCISLAGCSPFTLVNTLTPKGAGRVDQGISYGPEKRQQLDVYWPQEMSFEAPIVVFFYGGSWRRGERSNYRFVGETLSRSGVITVIPDYRIFPEVRFPAFVEDGALAVDWIRENLGPGPQGVFLSGHSAGAHLAALLVLDPRYLKKQAIDPSLIGGMIGLAGPYAFDPLNFRSTRPIFAGVEDPDSSRPITWACEDAPPVLLLHGADDRLVLPENSRKLYQRLLQCGNQASYVELDDVSHFDIVLGLSKAYSHLAPVLPPIKDFLGLQTPPASP